MFLSEVPLRELKRRRRERRSSDGRRETRRNRGLGLDGENPHPASPPRRQSEIVGEAVGMGGTGESVVAARVDCRVCYLQLHTVQHCCYFCLSQIQ